MQVLQDESADAVNPPLAPRMAIVAIASQNMVLGPIFGSFGVLLGASAERLGVPTEQAALGISLVFVSSSLLAGPVGLLLSRFSLRWLVFLGALLAALAFAVLGLTSSFALYLAAYALLLGPAMALAGMIGPATLVTRWFRKHGGFVQGLVYLPVVVAIMPLTANAILSRYGLTATYLLIAALIAIILLPLTVLIIDHPPAETQLAARGAQGAADMAGVLKTGTLLSQPRFWVLALATAAVTGAASTLGALLVQMAKEWDVGAGQAALLITIMSTVGMAGSVLFGWVADRIGGARGLVILTLGTAILWFLLAQALPYPVRVAVIALLGLCAAGAIPNLSRALAEFYGTVNFSKSFGLAATIGLPLNVAVVPLVPWIRSQTGSYVPAMLGVAMMLTLAFVSSLFFARRSTAPAVAPAIA